MTNSELNDKLKDICLMPNYIEALLAIKRLEPEYKKTDFYKETKISIADLIKNAKIWYITDLTQLGSIIQKLIDGLSLEKIQDIINQIGQTFEEENEEITEAAQTYKELLKK
jgi:hypothetical protein